MIVKYEGRSVQVRTVEKVAEKLLTVHSASSVFLSTAATSQKLHINYRETHYWAGCTPGHAEALTFFHLSKILENCILMVAVAAPTVFIFTNEVFKSIGLVSNSELKDTLHCEWAAENHKDSAVAGFQYNLSFVQIENISVIDCES